MSNDDHKKAPQSPEEMLEMVGKARDPWKREEMAAGGGDGGEEAKGSETVAREEVAQAPRLRRRDRAPTRKERSVKGSKGTVSGAFVTPSLGVGSLSSSYYRAPEENEKAQDTTGSEEDQDRCKGTPIEHVELSISGQKIENAPRADLEALCGKLRDGSIPIVPMDMFDLRPDPDVMGYLHSRYGVAPVMRKLCEVYDVRLGAVRLAFSPQEDEDEWYFEVEAIGSFDCGFVDGKLSDACDHVDQIAREILQGDLIHF